MVRIHSGVHLFLLVIFSSCGILSASNLGGLNSYDSNFDRRARWTSVAAICSVSV
jgi:hypothetical protein